MCFQLRRATINSLLRIQLQTGETGKDAATGVTGEYTFLIRILLFFILNILNFSFEILKKDFYRKTISLLENLN